MKQMKRIFSIVLVIALLCITSVAAYAQSETSGTYKDTSPLKSYDPLLLIQQTDNCKLEKQDNKKALVTLSDGTKTVYEKMDADFSGIKYNVTEGDLHATLEITKNNDMYINGKLVEYNEGEVEKIDYTIPDFSSGSVIPQAGGWIKWTTSPLWGKASDYTKNIKNVKKGNILLKSAIQELPLAVLLAAITSPLGMKVAIGTAFASQTKAIYSAAKMNPKKLWYNERINKYSKSDHATQYRTMWVDGNGKAIKAGKYQYGYCTIG